MHAIGAKTAERGTVTTGTSISPALLARLPIHIAAAASAWYLENGWCSMQSLAGAQEVAAALMVRARGAIDAVYFQGRRIITPPRWCNRVPVRAPQTDRATPWRSDAVLPEAETAADRSSHAQEVRRRLTGCAAVWWW